MDDILESYRILEIGPNVSLEEVKQAYRELARWHPDRFPNDFRLQQKAQEKLKQINIAYERICGRGWRWPHGTE
jgi:curved DNA-binding protein CbpA